MQQRRRYTAEERAAAIAAWRTSGMSMNAWAQQAGMSQGTLWNWVHESSRAASSDAATSGVEFVRVDSCAVPAALGVVDAEAGGAMLHGEMALDDGELRVVARRGTRWSDVERMVALLRGAK